MTWDGYRKFRIFSKVQEGRDIWSFYLEPLDGQPLPPFLPGQYLTFQTAIPGVSKPVTRCYSLSDSPFHADYYRITVKKIPPRPGDPRGVPGLGSGHFVDRLAAGDVLDVKAPQGRFCLDVNGRTPAVLLAGGIGVTPLLSMLNAVVESGSGRETWFFLGVRDGDEHIMKDRLRQIARENENVHLHVCYSRPSDEYVLGHDYHRKGHVDIDLLKELLPSKDFEFYVCGPSAMMDALLRDLKAWGVPEGRIFHESFGQAPPPAASASRASVEIKFAKSGKSVPWDPSAGFLLDLAERNGIDIDFGCRSGNCGTCCVRLISGEVDYPNGNEFQPEPGSCLTCCTVPKTDLILDV